MADTPTERRPFSSGGTGKPERPAQSYVPDPQPNMHDPHKPRPIPGVPQAPIYRKSEEPNDG